MMITYSKVIAKEIGNISADLKFLEQTYSANIKDRLEIENQWFLFCKNKHIYDQIRYINEFGNEKIKVTYNYGSNESRCIDDYQLRNKYKEIYIRETFKLDKNKIYISELDLNGEDGNIEEATKPVIRFSTPVYDRSGNLQGAIVLNYLAKNMIEEFKNMSKLSNGKVYLLNKDGDFLYNGNAEEQWGFMQVRKDNISFQDEFKEEWQMIENGEEEILSDKGLFISSRINLEEIFKYDNKHALRNKSIVFDNDWIVVSFVDRYGVFGDAFEANLISRIKKVTKENILYFINITFISLMISFFIYLVESSYSKTKFLSEYDSMTGTLNRGAGFSRLERDIEMGKRTNQDICVSYIDVDGLKQVNDALGHRSGDELIITAIEIIKDTIRESDYIIRTGGDEFLIVFNNINTIQAENVWNRIRLKFEDINIEENREYIISISHGLVEIDREKDLSVEELVSMADQRMYTSKRKSGERINVLKDSITT